MAVSHRVTGTWAELTADGSVAIPSTPQVGDRMYLFARWKDFSITATVANWTELAEFADGSTSSGNGTGSVKVGCWYRDWQSGDTDPTIDFSSSPTNASVVIIVMAKGASDVWLTPVAVTAAMTNWTTSSQIVSASSTAAVKGGGVVMGLIGIRDDTATMTRPTSGIDDSAGAITWNGDYVEAPATHHSTTTGDDGAADLGYRLVSAGATATLRMTGTISAAETGAALWVVQGVSVQVTPGVSTVTVTRLAATLLMALTPATATLTTAQFAPQLREVTIPATQTVTVTKFVPSLSSQITPPAVTLTVTLFDPRLQEATTPATASLSVSSFTAQLGETVTPFLASLNTVAFAPTPAQATTLLVPSASLTIITSQPHVLPFRLIYLDPGGDSVQAVGHFNTAVTGTPTYDTSQSVVGPGSYKFDSGDGTIEVAARIAGVLGPACRMSFYWRYDTVPDAMETVFEFVNALSAYSGGGFSLSGSALGADDEIYATATPAKNAGQGHVFGSFSLDVPIGAVIDSVKIIYERKYDVDTSIGISRVKTRVNGEEGPDYDNTDMPLSDTVVEVDVTNERGWTWQDLQNGVFEVIAEARRGDTDTAHTQSWDYLKVQVQYHLPAVIVKVLNSDESLTGFQIAVTPKNDSVVLRFVAGDGDSFDGITPMFPNTNYRISFGYVLHGLNDLDIKLYIDNIEELAIEEASTGGASEVSNLHYGWILSPGVNHVCWFDLLAIDDGDDLADPGDIRSTHKGPATVNENNWNTTVGTGAVNERPLSETNHMKHTSVTGVRQTYTLQAADEGDVDISGEVIKGHMGWAWAKLGGTDTGDALALVVNNVEVNQNVQITTSPSLLKHPVTSPTYPSHAAGSGMRSNDEASDTFMYECGAVLAYQGPDISPRRILAYQLLAEDTVLDLVDDLRADPPDSYELCYQMEEGPANLAITIHSITSEEAEPQFQGIIGGQGSGRIRITPGIEVQVHVEVTNAPAKVGIWHRLNVD